MAANAAGMFAKFSDTHQILDRMNASQKERLTRISSVREFTAKQQIASLSHPVDGIYFIVEGSVRLESYSEEGERFLVGDLQSGDVFGFLAVLDQKPSIHDATAVGPTTAIFVSGGHFRRFIYSDPELARSTIEIMCQRLRMSLLTLERFAPASMSSRVVRCLLLPMDSRGARPDAGTRRQIAITQFDLAAMLSISRQSVHRVLKDLEGQGIISIGYNVIEIHDVERLQALR